MTRFAHVAAILLFASWAFAQEIYSVVPGDTLFGIAGRFDTSVEVLQGLNDLAGTTIRVGQRLRLPESEPTMPKGYRHHTVAAGETLGAIASRYGVSEAVLRAVNPEFETGIPAGAVLRVPPTGGELITLHDTAMLLSLALERGLAPSVLLRANGLDGIDDLRPGQAMFIPPRAAALSGSVYEPRGGVAADRPAGDKRSELVALGREVLADAARLLPSYEPYERGYGWPLPVSGQISSLFGRRNISVGGNTYHGGVDIAAPPGTRILASRGGLVVRSSWAGAYGYVVYVDHADGSQTRYAHMSRILATAGQAVSRGDVLGLVGSTGASTGPHLHFEIRFGGHAVDPLGYLQQP